MQVVMIGANACGDEVLLSSDNAMRMMMMVAMTMTSPLLTAQTLAPNSRLWLIADPLWLIAEPLWLIAEPLCTIRT